MKDTTFVYHVADSIRPMRSTLNQRHMSYVDNGDSIMSKTAFKEWLGKLIFCLSLSQRAEHNLHWREPIAEK